MYNYDDEIMHAAVNIIHTRDDQLMHRQTNNQDYKKLEDYVLQVARRVVNSIPDNVTNLFKELNQTKTDEIRNRNAMSLRQRTTKQDEANWKLFQSYLIKMAQDVKEQIANEKPELLRSFSNERSNPMIYECLKYILSEDYPALGISIKERYKAR